MRDRGDSGMYKIITLMAALVVGLSTYKLTTDRLNYSAATKIETNEAILDLNIPKVEELGKAEEAIKLRNSGKTITLEKSNTLVLRGPVTSDSVAKLQQKINILSHKLSKKSKIYLVIDTPGGSVFAGMELIDHLRAIPQKIQTITLFAASMGFQIVQNMDKRYITPSGTLMSHRARGGVRGQFDGEFETRYKMVKRKINYLDAISAKRMELSVVQYKKLIKDEYWVHGFDARAAKAVDEMVNLTCGESLSGEEVITVRTFFGPTNITFSKCPVIRGSLKVDLKRIKLENRFKVKDALNKAFLQKERYVEDFILTGKHYDIFL